MVFRRISFPLFGIFDLQLLPFKANCRLHAKVTKSDLPQVYHQHLVCTACLSAAVLGSYLAFVATFRARLQKDFNNFSFGLVNPQG